MNPNGAPSVLWGILLSQHFHTLGHFGPTAALCFRLLFVFHFIIILELGKLSPSEVTELDPEPKYFSLHPLFILINASLRYLQQSKENRISFISPQLKAFLRW